MLKFYLFLVISFLLSAFFTKAQSSHGIDNGIKNTGSQYPIYIEENKKFDLIHLNKKELNVPFYESISNIKPLQDVSFWIKINSENIPIQQNLLEVYIPFATWIEIYAVSKNRNQYLEYKVTNLHAYQTRKDYYHAEIEKSTSYIYIHVNTSQFSGFVIKNFSKKVFFEKERWLNVYYGIIIGTFLLLILYHTVLYFKVNDRTYLFYSLYIIVSGLLILPQSGYLLINKPWFSHLSFTAFQIACILFSASYIHLYKTINIWKIRIAVMVVLSIIINVLYNIWPSIQFKILTHIFSFLIYFGIIYASILNSKNFNNPDRLFLFPWVVLSITHLAYLLNFEFIFEYYTTFELGLLINICILALAIGNKLNIYKNEKNIAEIKEIMALQERDKIIHEQNNILLSLINDRHKEIIKKNKILSDRQKEIEEHNQIIKNSNQKLEIINQQLYQKNNEIDIQNQELERHKELLEIIVEKRTQKLVAAKERAIVADQLKTSFLNNLTYEIHTPMNAIMGFASLLINKNITKTKRNEYLTTINRNVDILLESIDNVVILAKIQARAMKLKAIDFMLSELFKKCEDFFIDKLKSTGNNNIKIIYKNLNQKKDYAINADYDKIWQILYKLIDNSIKYTAKGEVEIAYTIEKISSGANFSYNLNIKVKDTGVGIEKEKREFIFERFSNIEEDKTKLYHGAGIGLAIVKGLIDIINGSINVKSELNKGSIFEIIIPIIIKE